MARDDDMRVQFYAEFDDKHGIKQVDNLFKYIADRQKELEKNPKNVPLFEAGGTIKEIVKVKNEYYKVVHELGKVKGKYSVALPQSMATKALDGNLEAFKATSKDLKEIVGADVKAQVEKRIQLEKQRKIQNEIFAKAKLDAHGNRELEKSLIKQYTAQKKIKDAQAKGSPKNVLSRFTNQYLEAQKATKAIVEQERAIFKQEKAQEKLNQKIAEYKSIISDTVFGSSQDISRLETKLMSEQTIASAKGLDASGFNELLTNLREQKKLYEQIGAEWRALVGEQLSKKDQLKLILDDTRKRLKTLKEQFVQLRASGKDVKALSKEISDTAKEAKKLEKAIKPSWFEKLVNTFKRIGFYRLARDFFRLTINAFKEGIQGLAQFDKVANDTMSEWSSSMTIIKMSLAQMLLSVVQMLVPAVRDVATAFAEIANNVGQAVAKMRGLSTYTKINTEYMKKYGEEANSALSFDKFEALSGGNDQYEGLFIKDAQVEQNNEAIDSWVAGLETIKTVLSSVWEIIKTVIKALKNVWDNAIAPNLDTILYAIEFVIDAIGKIIVGLSKFLVWLTKNKEVALGIAGVIGVILTSVGTALMSPKMIASGVALTTLSVAGFVSTAVGNRTVDTSSNANISTGLNSSSMKNAMVDALYEASSGGMFNSEGGDFVIKLDGAEIARSKRFKSELNRTNSNLNLI